MQRILRTAIFGFCAIPAMAQLGPPSTGGSSSTAAQLPLSGRGAQSGSVNSAQTPLPGITSSVNTLNSTIQVQGPYSGSVQQGALTGALTLEEAVHRGIQYN